MAERTAAADGALPWLRAMRQDDAYRIEIGGAWETAALAAVEPAVAGLAPPERGAAVVDLAKLTALDTNGAWLISRIARDLGAAGLAVRFAGATDVQRGLLAVVGEAMAPVPEAIHHSPVVAVLIRLGKATIHALEQGRDLVNFLGATVIAFLGAMCHPRRIRLAALASHMETAGLNALPIVGLLSFLIGVVMAYQGVDQLRRFGAEIFVVNIVGIGMLREMGILMTAIIVAGRSGSAYAAQIGTMAVNQEIDAMRTIGLDPMDLLVLPRVLALCIVLPLLTFYANILGILGGAVMAMTELDISLVQFMRQLNVAVDVKHFWVGMIKAPVFGYVIAMVGCFEGLRVAGSAESVGRMTTRAVVEGVFLVIVLDAFASIMFSLLEM
jgi:phospholipid/cholesterol/gamma-HCH transport system permease protein